MKVIINGKEIEIDTNLEKGEIEMDKVISDDLSIIMDEDTIELTEEMLNKIEEENRYV